MKHLLALAFVSCALAQTPIATPTVGTWYHLQNKAGLCLSAQGSNVRMQTCVATDAAQSFLMTALAGGYGFIAQSSGLVLDVYGEGKTNGVPLDTFLYHAGANQIFALAPVAVGTFYLKPTHDNLCLETTVANAAVPGSLVVQWSCLNGANQQWQFVTYGPVPPPGAVMVIINAPVISASEEDTAAIDGAETVFPLSYTPIAGSVHAYFNGVRISPSAVSVSGSSVTLDFAPQLGDHILIDYLHN